MVVMGLAVVGDLQDMALTKHIILAILAVLCVLGNSLLIITILKHKRIRYFAFVDTSIYDCVYIIVKPPCLNY